MRSNLLATFILFLAVSLSVQSQIGSPAEFDKKYTPNEASPFSDPGRSETAGDDAAFSNAVKFVPTMLFRQKAMFYYERRIIDGLTLQLGLGKAFGKDFIEYAAFVLFTNYDYTNETLLAEELLSNSIYYNSKLLLSASARIYLQGTAFEDGYLEFNYRRETISYQLSNEIGNWRVDGSTIADFSMTNYNFGFGFCSQSGKKNKMTHDFFMFFGIKTYLHTRYDLIDNSNNSGVYGDTYYQRSGSAIKTRILPSFQMGYAFGFGF